jgi:hypothetical protein
MAETWATSNRFMLVAALLWLVAMAVLAASLSPWLLGAVIVGAVLALITNR